MPPRQFLEMQLDENGIAYVADLARGLETELDEETLLWLLSRARHWHMQGFVREQQAICEMVLRKIPGHFEALHLLGFAAWAEGDSLQAERYYLYALEDRPDFAFARLALAQMRMMHSGFTQGLEDYEARFDAVTEGSGPDWRGLPVARWRGEPVQGKKLYLWAEQGLGDIVMFAGFLPRLLAQRPARLALGLPPKLASLFARSFPDLTIEPPDDAIHLALGPAMLDSFAQIEQLAGSVELPFPLEPLKAAHAYAKRHGLFDFAAPMGDLMVYGAHNHAPAPYLKADSARVKRVQESLGLHSAAKRVGISWATSNAREWMRNLPLEYWLPLLRQPGYQFVSLQHGEDVQETKRFCAAHQCAIAHAPGIDLLDDAEGLAALAASMDHVVTVDNANAHLAGALGIPTTLLLPRGHNYRWPLRENGATLWYPHTRILRQQIAFDWHGIMEEALKYM